MPDELQVTPERLAVLAAEAGLTGVSLVVGQLENPAGWSTLDADRRIYPASMIKVPLVAACLLEIAAGRFFAGTQVEVSASNMTANDEDSPLVPGYRATVEELMRLAVERSITSPPTNFSISSGANEPPAWPRNWVAGPRASRASFREASR